jgi:hypothetical protein
MEISNSKPNSNVLKYDWTNEFGYMAPELQWGRFLKNLKMVFKSFEKIEIIFLDVDNNKIY